jgi:protein-S-isoprenylcysteine O-methyltransferase Ste14
MENSMTMTASELGNPSLPQGIAARSLILVYGVVVYLAFFVTFSYIPIFLADVGPGPTVDHGWFAAATPAVAAAINIGLMLLFGIQHSVMARRPFKQWLATIMPEAAERTTFVLASTLVFIALFAFWQPIDTMVWQVGPLWACIALYGVMLFGFLLALYASFLLNHFDLFGLRQVWLAFRGRPYSPVPFVKPTIYRHVRHPLQVGLLMVFWGAPTMTAGHLMLTVGMTIYILIGLWFEERDLVREHGEAYEHYRREVPKLLPLSFGRR